MPASADGIPYAVLLHSSTDLLSVHDGDGVVRYANDACERLLGLPAAAFVGTNPFRLVHPDDRAGLIARMAALRRQPGEVHVFAVRARHADGTYRHLESTVRNGLDDPQLRGVLLSTRDVTERARAAVTLRASELRYRELVESLPVGLVVADVDGQVRYANPTAQQLTGIELLDDLLGQPVAAFVKPGESERCAAALRVALVDRVAPEAAEYRLARADGADAVVTSAPLPYEWDGAPAALLILQDVTALDRAREERTAVTEQLRRILEATADGVVGVDRAGLVTFVNPAAAELLGLDAQAVLGRPAHALYHHSHADGSPYPEQDCPCLQAARGGPPVSVVDEVLWRSDGTPIPVEYRALPLRSDEPSGAVLTFHDLSERVLHRERLARLAAFQSAVLDSLLSLTAVVDAGGRIIAVNQAWTTHLLAGGGTPETCAVGANFLDVCEAVQGPARDDSLLVAEGLGAVLAGAVQEFEQDIPCEYQDEATVFFSLSIVPLHVPEGGVVISYTDITRRKALEVAAAHRATHDVLTGLPNRTLLLDRLEHALSSRGAPTVAVLFLDLDAFKLVNDGYGHEAGDAVLRELADRLRRHVRPADTVARLAGDEFVVLCEDLAAGEADALAERLIAGVAEPFAVGEESITLGMSIGIAVAGPRLDQPDALLNAADQAMFDAKARGRNRFTVYDAGVHGRHHVRLAQAMTLRGLVERNDLLVHYQPVVDLRDGHLEGAEALLRWRGEHELPDTATAIALAEEIGLIGRIGRFVLTEAIAQASTFLTPDGTQLPVAVNLAPQQLETSLVGFVEQAADQAGYPLSLLTLELTERSVMTDPDKAVDVLQALRALGVRIALDDFGVGYSSLAYLRDLPLDVLKIDAGFVRGLVGAHPNGRIISAIVEMARALDLEIVAEGIEMEVQRDRLLELGCERGQGFLYSPARSHRELRALAR